MEDLLIKVMEFLLNHGPFGIIAAVFFWLYWRSLKTIETKDAEIKDIGTKSVTMALDNQAKVLGAVDKIVDSTERITEAVEDLKLVRRGSFQSLNNEAR